MDVMCCKSVGTYLSMLDIDDFITEISQLKKEVALLEAKLRSRDEGLKIEDVDCFEQTQDSELSLTLLCYTSESKPTDSQDTTVCNQDIQDDEFTDQTSTESLDSVCNPGEQQQILETTLKMCSVKLEDCRNLMMEIKTESTSEDYYNDGHQDFISSEIMAGLLKLRLPGGERNLPKNENGPDVVSRTSKAAAGMRRYRAKLKQNPKLYVLHRLEEQQRLKEYRKNLSDEKKEIQKAQARERMRRYRERQKENLQGGKKSQGVISRKPQTRSELEKIAARREYFKNKKREQRARMSAQKKRQERKKDRNRKRVLAGANKASSINNNPPNHTGVATPANQESNPVQTQCQLNATPVLSTSSGYKNDFSRRKATWRIKRLMPKSPQKYGTIVAGLVASASPREKTTLHDMMLGGDDKDLDSVLGYVKQTCKQMSTANRKMFNGNLAAILGSASKPLWDASSRKLRISQKIIRKYDRLRNTKKLKCLIY